MEAISSCLHCNSWGCGVTTTWSELDMGIKVWRWEEATA
jgi:hypothetical protein